MKSTIKEQNKYMLSPLTWVGVIVFIALFQVGYNALAWAYEGISSKEAYYEYNGVYPQKESFFAGEPPRFITDAEYYRDIDVRWEDTLFCLEKGHINKYPTQYWPENGFERKEAGFKTLANATSGSSVPTWAYFISPVDTDATRCVLKWKVIGETKHGWEKNYSGYTEWFEVNK